MNVKIKTKAIKYLPLLLGGFLIYISYYLKYHPTIWKIFENSTTLVNIWSLFTDYGSEIFGAGIVFFIVGGIYVLFKIKVEA